MDSEFEEDSDGTKHWYDGEVHCRMETNSDTVYWYKNDNLHRDDGPAVIHPNGDKFWYFHGRLHRDGLPAIEWSDGSRTWYFFGDLHREDGPAIETADGEKSWYIRGKLHREDGPAIINSSGASWWLDGEFQRVFLDDVFDVDWEQDGF